MSCRDAAFITGVMTIQKFFEYNHFEYKQLRLVYVVGLTKPHLKGTFKASNQVVY